MKAMKEGCTSCLYLSTCEMVSYSTFPYACYLLLDPSARPPFSMGVSTFSGKSLLLELTDRINWC